MQITTQIQIQILEIILQATMQVTTYLPEGLDFQKSVTIAKVGT